MNGSSILKRLDRIEALEERSRFFVENEERNLYDKSNSALFFALNKLYFIFKRNDQLKNDKENIEILRNKIKEMSILLENNKYLSSTNSKIVKIINKNNIFIDIYYIQNYLLSIKYRLRDKVIKRRVV